MTTAKMKKTLEEQIVHMAKSEDRADAHNINSLWCSHTELPRWKLECVECVRDLIRHYGLFGFPENPDVLN